MRRSSTEAMDEQGSSGVYKVELMISCTDLPEMDEFSASDPICVLFIKQFGQWRECSRTEAIIDSNNPEFTKSFLIDYDPDIQQQLMFSVYDIDSKSTELTKHDYIGSVEENLINLIKEDRVSTTSRTLHIPGKSDSRGYIIIKSEIVRETRSKVLFHIGGRKLDKKGMFSISKNDVFLEVSRSVNSIDFHPVHRTEVFRKSQEPRWRPFELNLQKLCNNDQDRAIRFSCFHRKGNGAVDLIGHAVTTVRELVNHNDRKCFEVDVIEPNKSSKKSYQNSGLLQFYKCRLDLQHTLLDYVRGGCKIKITVAIDFTASNGKNGSKMSLHTLDAIEANQYVQALEEVGSLLASYMVDNTINAYGFGAKIKKNKKVVSHCFPLNYKTETSDCKGVQGVLEAYRYIVPKLKFSGPTLFSPILTHVIESVKKEQLSQENQLYHTVVILTDGVINDFDKAIDKIIESSHLPVSVIVCGVGPADFSTMDQLFSTRDLLLKSHSDPSKKAIRDNTYFVLLRKEKYSTRINHGLIREMMASMSQQVLKYMKSKSIQPNKPILSKVDPFRYWVSNNPDEMDSSDIPMMKSSYQSSASLNSTFTQSTGAACPTCGSSLDPESPLFNFTDSLVN